MTLEPLVYESLNPAMFPNGTIPTLPSLSLTEDERQLMGTLQAEDVIARWEMLRALRYYDAEQRVKNLRIAVPAEVEEKLHTVVGWPQLAVDPYVEGSEIDGFRVPGATEVDQDLADLWTENRLAAQLPLATTDALSLGRAYWMGGSPLESGGPPVVRVESPLNVLVRWDLDGVTPRAAYQRYYQGGRLHAVLMKPGENVALATDDKGQWIVTDRDRHGYDFVPLVRMSHQPRTISREGRSAITRPIRSIVDSVCRDLLGLEVAREIFAVPGITLLGALEADFQNADGTSKSAWETYITRVRALERDEEGNLPEIHQAQVYSPEAFTKLIEMRASQMASLVAAPPQDLGLYTEGNPVSADAVGAMETRRSRRKKRMRATWGEDMADVTRMMVRFVNRGRVPDELRRLTVDWVDDEDVPFASAADSVSKLVAVGVLPKRSDVTLRKLGFSAVDRARIAQDLEAEADATAAQEIIAAVQQRQAQTPAPANGQQPPATANDQVDGDPAVDAS